MIAEKKPFSIAELSERSGRARTNLSRTLHTMERYGLVRLEKGDRGRVVPRSGQIPRLAGRLTR